jgi:endoglucanase
VIIANFYIANMSKSAKIFAFLAFFAVFSFAQGSTGPVPYHGRLKAVGNKLVGENSGVPVQVRGMSFFFFFLDWDDGKYAKFWTAATVDAMVDGWKSEVLRAAMAANNENGCGDYQSKKTQTIEAVKIVVNRAIERDIYIVIDWHSHQAHQQQASVIDFFVNEMREYHNKPHVIFEIYNEPPDGDANQWATIKPYMQAVVTAIRNANANNLILVGTPYYDQDPDIATGNPVTGTDLAYVLHFYAAEHKLDGPTIGRWRLNNDSKTFRTSAVNAMNANYPLFVSEYGTVMASGNGSFDANSSDAWHSFMDQHKISSCNWSINNKGETASAFVTSFNTPTTGSDAAWTNKSNMTESGKYTYDKLASYAPTADWRNNPPPASSSSSLDISSSSSSSDDPSPITISKAANGPIRVHAISKAIVLENLPSNTNAEVYNLHGVLVYSANSGNSQILKIPVQTKGLYIVRHGSSGGKAIKVLVK